MVKTREIRVRFAVASDEQAAKISALLEALGYEVHRDLDDESAHNRLAWAVLRLTNKAKLSKREAEVLTLVLQGWNNAQIADELKIRAATVKWHMHNIFTKTGTAGREQLLREALQLGSLPPAPGESEPSGDEDD